MAQIDPFEGLGRALAHLREKAGFLRQAQAADALGFERAQLSRWENDNLRPTLENLGRLLMGYGATLTDLANAIGGAQPPTTESADRRPTDEELIRALTEAIRRVEGRQVEAESRIRQIEAESRLQQIEGRREKDVGGAG